MFTPFWLSSTQLTEQLFQQLLLFGASAADIGGADALRDALGACFWASLEVQEGRLVRSSLVLASERSLRRWHESESVAWKFRHPLALESDNIQKLSAAFNAEQSVLFVRPGDGGKLHIWGIAHRIPGEYATITSVGSGQLIIRVGRRVAASLWREKMDLHDIDVPNELGKSFPSTTNEQREFLLRAAVAMRRLGHGGILIVNSDPAVQRWKGGQEVAADEEGAPAESPERIAQLSCVDGAVVLDDRLRLQSFGEKIVAETRPVRIELLEFPEQLPRIVELEELGGTRHQAAARLAWSSAALVVLVVSQDGGMSAMRRHTTENGAPFLFIFRRFERGLQGDYAFDFSPELGAKPPR